MFCPASGAADSEAVAAKNVVAEHLLLVGGAACRRFCDVFEAAVWPDVGNV